MPLNLRGQGGSRPLINFVNLSIRFLQIIFSATVIGIYASQMNNDAWWPIHGKLVLAETVAAMSLVTAVTFAAIPFVVSYYYVAIAFVWDWILFFIWCAVFATQKKHFSDKDATEYAKGHGISGVDMMVATQWVDLAAMLLFLASAVMGPVCLLMDRKSLFASRAVV